MLEIARCTRRPAFFLCKNSVETFLVVLRCISNLLFPGCPLHALDNVLLNAVVDRVRVVRLENYGQTKSMVCALTCLKMCLNEVLSTPITNNVMM